MEITSTIVDAVIAGAVLISAILAYSRGFTREVFTLGVWILAAVAALNFYPIVEPIIRDFKDLGELTPWIAIVIAFVLALTIFTVIGSAITSIIRNSGLGVLDKGLGFLFGAARGLVILAIVWILFEKANPASLQIEAIDTSRGATIVSDTAQALYDFAPKEMPEFLQRAADELFDNAPGATTDPVNEILDTGTITE